MKTFNDITGRPWSVSITVSSVKRVKSLLDVNLLDVLNGELLKRLQNDPILVADIVYAVCKPEADQRQVSDEEFGQALGGDSIKSATDALLEELADFFPNRRQMLLAAIKRVKDFETKATEQVTAKINSPEMDQLLDKELGSLFGNAPASSESTQAN